MRFPQVTDRVKEAPAHALRAMFAGIGQVLLVADRMRSRPAGPDAAQLTAAEHHESAAKVTPAPSSPEPAHRSDESRWRSLDQTGNVRILPVAYRPGPPIEPAPAGLASVEPIVAEPTAPELVIAEPAEAEPAGAEPAIDEPDAAEPAGADTGPIIAELVPAEPAHTDTGPIIAELVPAEPAGADTGPIIAELVPAEPAGADTGPIIAELVPAEPAHTDTGPIIAELVPAEPAGADTGPAIAEPVPAEPADADTGPIIAEPVPAEPALAWAPLPVPNYDDLSVASLRARLRNLDSVQVQVLLAYERAHAARPAVLTMFERRIAKLGGSED
jgi:hypothetical protein